MPTEDRSLIGELLRAATPDRADEVLSSFPDHAVRSFSFLLGFDLLYDIVHNNAVAFLAMWGARRCASRQAYWAGSTVAWVMWLDTALNFPENLAFLRILETMQPWPLLPWASGTFFFRTSTWLAGLAVGVALHALAAWRARS